MKYNNTTTVSEKGYFNLFNALSDLPCEKLHISFFFKYIFGFHRKATNAIDWVNLVNFLLSLSLRYCI